MACSEKGPAQYLVQDQWVRMSSLNTVRWGYFSSDRIIRQYVGEIWRAQPVPVPCAPFLRNSHGKTAFHGCDYNFMMLKTID